MYSSIFKSSTSIFIYISLILCQTDNEFCVPDSFYDNKLLPLLIQTRQLCAGNICFHQEKVYINRVVISKTSIIFEYIFLLLILQENGTMVQNKIDRQINDVRLLYRARVLDKDISIQEKRHFGFFSKINGHE